MQGHKPDHETMNECKEQYMTKFFILQYTTTGDAWVSSDSQTFTVFPNHCNPKRLVPS
jgi:hypothetical protein